MGIGFPAFHEDTFRFRKRSRKELLRAAEDALDEIGWPWRDSGRWRLRAVVPGTPFLSWWGERLIVEVDNEEVWVRSEFGFALAWLDLGKNYNNVQRFISTLEDMLEE